MCRCFLKCEVHDDGDLNSDYLKEMKPLKQDRKDKKKKLE